MGYSSHCTLTLQRKQLASKSSRSGDMVQRRLCKATRDSTYEHGFPQIEHLMQTALYLHTRKAFEDFHNVEIPYFVICYISRDNGLHKSFRIELSGGLRRSYHCKRHERQRNQAEGGEVPRLGSPSPTY